jgi:hypothetical protein
MDREALNAIRDKKGGSRAGRSAAATRDVRALRTSGSKFRTARRATTAALDVDALRALAARYRGVRRG